MQPQLTFTGNNNPNQDDNSGYNPDGYLDYTNGTSYAFDAEGRIVSLNGQLTYLYDAEGQRVAKYSGGTISASYLLDLGGNQVTELNGSGTWMHSNVWATGGRLLATYEGPGESHPNTYHFHLTDWLGTQRMQTTAAGNSEEVCYSYPFGDGLTCTGSDATEHHFTGKERDAESGLDYFYARYYSSNFARFMTPDWAGAPTAVPYATFGDPQSLNLYAYVGNNPNTGIDLDGHFNDMSGNNMPDGGGGVESFGNQSDQNGSGQDSGNPTGAGSNSGSSGSPPTAEKPKAPDPEAQQQGSGTAGTIYNETSTLREDGKTVGPNLHNARVAIAQVIDVNHSTAKVASPTVQDNLNYPPAGAAMKDSQAAVSEESTAPNGTQGATHFFLAGGNTPTPAWVSQGKVVESFGPFPVAANTHDFSKGQSATIQIIQYPVPKQ